MAHSIGESENVMKTLKKLVGDHNKQISKYFESPAQATEFITEHFINPECFSLDELKLIVTDLQNLEQNKPHVTKTATEMLKDAGFEILKCSTYKDYKKFEKYFAAGDKWCKFDDKDRINKYDIFIVWNPSLLDMPRPDNKIARNGDEYSTSLISIGVKGSRMYQICQRYNHGADNKNTDNLYKCNLNNWMPDLQDAFNAEFGYTVDSTERYMPDNTEIINNQYFKFDREVNGIKTHLTGKHKYIDGKKIDLEHYIVACGVYLLDKTEITLKSIYNLTDGFIDKWNETPKENRAIKPGDGVGCECETNPDICHFHTGE